MDNIVFKCDAANKNEYLNKLMYSFMSQTNTIDTIDIDDYIRDISHNSFKNNAYYKLLKNIKIKDNTDELNNKLKDIISNIQKYTLIIFEINKKINNNEQKKVCYDLYHLIKILYIDNIDLNFIDKLIVNIQNLITFNKYLLKCEYNNNKDLGQIIENLEKNLLLFQEIIDLKNNIKELQTNITNYIKKDIKKDIQEDINNYCSNIYFFYNKIVKNNNNNNEEFQKAYDEFQKCIKNTTPNISSIKKSKKPIFSIFSKKAKTIPITNDIDNCFLSFYRKIIAIYKNSNYSDYSDYIINIKTFLFYIGNLHYIYKKVNNITKKYEHDEEPPELKLKYFLFVKLGGKNKSEFINYKYEDKIYKRKIRHDGKKIYIIINKQKIFIKKLK